MPKFIIIFSLTALCLLFALWDSIAPPQGISSTAQYTQPSAEITTPNSEFTDINGQNYTLHQFKGKTIILNFWATWCPPCIAEFPQLLELAKREGDHIVLIALSVDENPKKIDSFFKSLPEDVRTKLSLENVIIGLDTDKAISKNQFNSAMYPETFIIDKDLMITHKVEGITDWLGLDIKRQLYKDQSNE